MSRNPAWDACPLARPPLERERDTAPPRARELLLLELPPFREQLRFPRPSSPRSFVRRAAAAVLIPRPNPAPALAASGEVQQQQRAASTREGMERVPLFFVGAGAAAAAAPAAAAGAGAGAAVVVPYLCRCIRGCSCGGSSYGDGVVVPSLLLRWKRMGNSLPSSRDVGVGDLRACVRVEKQKRFEAVGCLMAACDSRSRRATLTHSLTHSLAHSTLYVVVYEACMDSTVGTPPIRAPHTHTHTRGVGCGGGEWMDDL